ncbi:hypothetical protein BDA99DRAFT_558312 [Phascolomyces articulosus]|uniref:Uncharacterized protein n=1 Tax=Phascolomyces articulosus TaxID=60185 RepID=A0AAD5K414_9FUNG|nr:hypothetical protein BDA99DRAFT_558312 [Phascolomyces articulosus]
MAGHGTETDAKHILTSPAYQAREANSSHSFILDLADENLRKEFTTKELEEIDNEKLHPFPSVSPKLLDYLHIFKTIRDLETRARKDCLILTKNLTWIGAQFSIQWAIRLFHAKYFPLTDQTESDIIRCVWGFIDTVFDNVDIVVRTGEMENVASSERNEQRAPNQRKQHGHKSNILFKVSQGEAGCSEVGKKGSGDTVWVPKK